MTQTSPDSSDVPHSCSFSGIQSRSQRARLFLILAIVVTLFAGCGESTSKPAGQAESPTDAANQRSPVPVPAPSVDRPALAMGTEGSLIEAEDVGDEESDGAPSKQPVPQRIYRDSDRRPIRDDARALEFGIQKYVSDRLILYSDLPREQVESLPALIDQAYEAWVDYFGELPPNREGTPYQMTGYVIDDPQRFVAAGMLPEGPPMFRFGRHIGAEFWMNKMNSDYYRRHLLIHEATHCFMTTMPRQYPPRWYLEGMAEYFGTHRLHPDGTVAFGVTPDASDAFPGLGRIELIRQELVQNRPVSLAQLAAFTVGEWEKPYPMPYAWSWAACEFLDKHPRYQKRFQNLGQNLDGPAFIRVLQESFTEDLNLLEAEWQEYIHRLHYQYDVAANAFVLFPEPIRELEEAQARTVQANQGWQSTGLKVTAGKPVALSATGEVILDQTTAPWRSEPEGISIRYAGGFPIGRLLAGVVPSATTEGQGNAVSFDVFSVGPQALIVPRVSGELFVRVNDLGNDLSKNSGQYEVIITPTDDQQEDRSASPLKGD